MDGIWDILRFLIILLDFPLSQVPRLRQIPAQVKEDEFLHEFPVPIIHAEPINACQQGLHMEERKGIKIKGVLKEMY